MTNVIFSVLEIICFVFLLVGKIFAGMWEIMPGNFCFVPFSTVLDHLLSICKDVY